MAHIRRHDYLVNLLQNVIETLLFYHPAVWWISNRIRVERE
jgi:D-alanyl-D-alanine endopeptidase (penicillin-binding protein 7)